MAVPITIVEILENTQTVENKGESDLVPRDSRDSTPFCRLPCFSKSLGAFFLSNH